MTARDSDSAAVCGTGECAPERIPWWRIKLCNITSLGSVQVVGFFDVAARLRAGDEPIAALDLVGGSVVVV